MFKKLICLLLVLCCIFSFGTTTYAQANNRVYLGNQKSFGDSNISKYDTMSRDELVAEYFKNIEVIENYLESQGITVLQGLCNEKARLESIL